MVWKVIKTIIIVLCIVFVLMYVTAKAKKAKVYIRMNPNSRIHWKGKKLFCGKQR